MLPLLRFKSRRVNCEEVRVVGSGRQVDYQSKGLTEQCALNAKGASDSDMTRCGLGLSPPHMSQVSALSSITTDQSSLICEV